MSGIWRHTREDLSPEELDRRARALVQKEQGKA
jgi:hypothetical protein